MLNFQEAISRVVISQAPVLPEPEFRKALSTAVILLASILPERNLNPVAYRIARALMQFGMAPLFKICGL
jgi:hypothetical protein